ncbi:class D sortase [Paenibacillus doosanensis]|uniref:class D sortase n=1 Tax=Paenibacillus doosanensis TaxID=1229154 RepID=UPI0021806861|nr:class D sortase [Paenibacillus doosanensis]MCS7463135.1 class D sortase [Paenibacillus doosanensis]
MIKKMLPMLCICLGIIVFLYPTVSDRYETYRQQQLLKQWTETMKQIDQADDTASTKPMAAPVPISAVIAPAPATTDGTPADETEASRQPQSSENEPDALQDALLKEQVEGILIIDKIDLKLPIITDATPGHLKLSAASIAGTGKAGAVGNYAIAGHRNLTYGKNFNRLDELDKGDVIEVDTGKQKYRYQVQEKLYVLPEDVWVLKGNGKDKEISLLTCHPMENPTHRLVVKGTLIEKQ